MESCRVPPSRSRAERGKNEAENIAFPSPSPFFFLSILLRRQVASPTALEPPVSKQNLMLLPREEWIFAVKKSFFFDFRGRGSSWLLLDDACALEGARKGKSFRRDCLPWSDTELRGNNITNKLFHVDPFSRGEMQRWIYLRRLCFFDEGRRASVFLRSFWEGRSRRIFYFSVSEIFFRII